ncbi:MAG: formylglycine-generating enzyme family protein [Synechocystis sp.]|nr:formylglycine-generating enzyme family protein [Synechocystis sp.]
MSAPPRFSTLERLVEFADQEQWQLDSYEFADLLWLWQIRCQSFTAEDWKNAHAEFQARHSSSTEASQDLDSDQIQEDDSSLSDISTETDTDSLGIGLNKDESDTSDDQNLDGEEIETDTGSGISKSDLDQEPGLPINVPDPKVIKETLSLNRAARPLIRTISSAYERELNLTQTVNITAELSLGSPHLQVTPVYQPKRIAPLDAIVLVELHRSMVLWKTLKTELLEWLTRLGAYRDVRVLGFAFHPDPKHPHGGEVRLTENLKHPNDLNLKAESIIAPRGDRQLFILSDCTSPAWYAGAYTRTLKEWSSRQCVCLLSPFAENFWHRTALNQGISVSLYSTSVRQPTQKWKIYEESSLTELALKFEQPEEREDYLKQCLRLPVITPDSFSISAWSGVMDGQGRSRCAGVLLEVPEKVVPFTTEVSTQADLPPTKVESAIRRFRRIASPSAWQLLQALTAVPINLSVMRLIGKNLIPHRRVSDFAEVLFSGLLVPQTSYDFFKSPSQINFRFRQGIREALQERSDKIYPKAVIDALSDFIGKKFGLTCTQFQARLLTNPQWFTDQEGELVSAFARIAATALAEVGREDLASWYQGSQSVLSTALEQKKIKEFLSRFEQKTVGIEVKTLEVLEEKAEKQFLNLKALFVGGKKSKFAASGIDISDGELRNGQLAALAQGIDSKDYQRQALFIFDQWQKNLGFKLQTWEGETVFVNQRGEVVKRQEVTAEYYEVDLAAIPSLSSGYFGGPMRTNLADYNSNPVRVFPGKELSDKPLPELQILRMLVIPGGILKRKNDQVLIEPFFLAQTPVTQAQWWAIARRTDLKVNRDLELTPSSFTEDFEGQSHWLRPVEKVNWYEAMEFCQRLAKLTGEFYCFPTEWQWQYACQAIRTPPDNGDYPPFHFGETLTDQLANYHADESKGRYLQQTTPVGRYPANAYGLQDMHGNVWEWMLNLDESDPPELINLNPTTKDLMTTGQMRKYRGLRVRRGGSWDNYPRFCRGADRDWDIPDNQSFINGFRVACRCSRP